jgi:VIT1/CCC1 family predicted Fe2+/Mn2+ transporter/GTPase SAR1 family protein
VPESGAPRVDLLADTIAKLESMRRLAVKQDRPDLAERLSTVRERLTELTVPVVVVGEFKRGKSTLVNALLRRSVCPVDADVVTAVPTVVRRGAEAGVTAFHTPAPDSPDGAGPAEVMTESLTLDDVEEAVSEFGRRGGRRPASVEIRLPHPLLRTGLSLVDTPGVGGLDSAHGLLTLGALDQAEGVLFVTDAAQELTAPEMQFLRMVLERCPTVLCVVTKTDLHAHWRRIVELDRGHLARAGVDLPVVGVSSFLRLQPVQDAALTEESGFRPLVTFLAERIKAGTQRATQGAGVEMRFVASQLGRQVEAERRIVTRPEDSERVVQTLTVARARTERLASPAAGWQQALSDRVQDLVSDIDHDLQQRLRTVSRGVDEVIDRGDPKDSWPDVEAWLRREVAAAVLTTYDTMRERADSVVADMAAFFDSEAGVSVEVTAPTSRLESVDLGELGPLGAGGRLAGTVVALRTGALIPLTLFAVASQAGLAGIAGAVILGPISLALFGAVTYKVVKDQRSRQLLHRRQLAKAAARGYLEEVSFQVGKDCRDALRLLQRRLRDEFQDRAAAMHRSSLATLAAAQEASGLDDAQRSDRAQTLAKQSAELRSLQQELSAAADAAPVRAVRRA